jgi:NAD(P)H-nitrite reductase large subunit
MGDAHVKYLLIGGGLAAFSAAKAIRQRDRQGAIRLVGQEINRPYYRTALSRRFLRRELARTELFTCGPDWFAENSVQLHTGRRAVHLDAARSFVTLDNGEVVAFDHLLLATGATPRGLGLPGDRLPNIFFLHSIEDAERLHTAIDKAKHEPRRAAKAVVIGGGMLGVEIAASIVQSGVGVDLVCGGAYPWKKFAGEASGKFVSHYLTRHGLAVHEGVRAQRVEGDGRAQRVVLNNGKVLPCDFLVGAVGTTPNKEMLRGTGVVAEMAILADEHCRTNVANIYAAGDCAAVRDPIFGRHRTPEQWDTAEQTGTVAGANMAGERVAFSAVTSFTTEFFGLTARGFGQSKHLQRRLVRGTPNVEKPDFLEIGVAADGRISFVLAVGHHGDDAVIEEIIRRRVPVDGNEEMLADAGIPLRKLID